MNCFLTHLLGIVYKLLRLHILWIKIYSLQVPSEETSIHFQVNTQIDGPNKATVCVEYLPSSFNVSTLFLNYVALLHEIISLKPFFNGSVTNSLGTF